MLPHNPTIILIHGALGSSASWQPFLPHLSEGYTCRAIDLPGHGYRAGLPHPFTRSYFREALLQEIEKESHVLLVGYSMGGYVAVDMANLFPDKVLGIITLGTKWAWDSAGAAAETTRLNPAIIQEKVPAFAAQLQQLHGKEYWEDVCRKTADFMLSLGHGDALQQSDFAQLQVPVWIGRGAADKMVGWEETAAVAGWMPKGNAFQLPSTPHPLDKVHPVWLTALISTFIAGLSR